MFLPKDIQLETVGFEWGDYIWVFQKDYILTMQDQVATHICANRTGAKNEPIQSCFQEFNPSACG
jgi:hypothetical protein